MTINEIEPPEFQKIRDIAGPLLFEAIENCEDIQAHIAKLKTRGYVVELGTGLALKWVGPDWEKAQKLAKEPRTCPRCTNGYTVVWMRPALVYERPLAEHEHEPISSAQVRWKCPLCGHGEIVPVGAPGTY